MAQIELRDIDEQIKKLQELRKVVSDPTMASLLNQLLAAKNGHSTPPTAVVQGEDKAKKRGDFIEKIMETCRSFGTGVFTIGDVIRAYEARGHIFNAQDKSVATYSTLKRLEKRKAIEIATRGIGSNPSKYRVVQ